MTRFNPTLIVNRLLIQRGGSNVYDEKFHTGLNIIRGENASGKSTLLNFLFYGLGGSLTDWSEKALLCSRVMVEVCVNGKVATLCREVSSELGRPMDIYGGDIDSALRATSSEWNRYPYARSPNKESFSQALFRLLNIPEASNESSGNVTMHQVLRLLYADQLSPTESIFKFENFDPPTLREAVGRLLCGAYDNRLYQNELRIRELNKQFDSINGELRSLFSIFGKTQENFTASWIEAEKENLNQELADIRRSIEETERSFFEAKKADSFTMEVQTRAYAEVQEIQLEIGKIQDKCDNLEFAIADSSEFIASLEHKIHSLNDVSSISDYIGEIQFNSCPACLSELVSNVVESACYLCKSPFDKEKLNSRVVSLVNDASLQLKQSEALQEKRVGELKSSKKSLSKLREQWEVASSRLAEARRLPSSETQESLRALHRRAGYIERELEELSKQLEVASMINELSQQKSTVAADLESLKTENAGLRASQQKRLSRAYTSIADEVKDLLNRDLRREEGFENPRSIHFDFAANTLSVDGKVYFSASSRVVLKNSFFAGFIAASMKESSFRHPRFCIIDTIEDKGMEPIRSQNFQLQLARISEQSKVEHQIIIATSMLVGDLDDESFTVGKYSTLDEPTLAIA